MKYEEFEGLKVIEDKDNPFCTLYELETGERFYIEPAFYTQLCGFKELRKESFPAIMDELFRLVRKNKHIVFTASYEYPQTVVDGYIYLEITDITDPLNIYVEDKSRGSDYGD